MADEPTNGAQRAVGIGELQRTVERNHKDSMAVLDKLALRMDRYLLREVYVAQYEALLDMVKRIDKDADDDRKTARAAEAANRQNSRLAVLTALATLAAGIALAVFNAFVHTGGH